MREELAVSWYTMTSNLSETATVLQTRIAASTSYTKGTREMASIYPTDSLSQLQVNVRCAGAGGVGAVCVGRGQSWD